MKIRAGYVSNSSSSSFVIDKYYLSSYQIEMIKNHIEESKRLPMPEKLYNGKDDAWSITETKNTIKGNTWMDNFDMCWFLNEINIPSEKIDWRD